jgi:hypothetical protein
MEIEHGSFEAIKSKITKSLKDILLKDTVLPKDEKDVACEMHVPYHQVSQGDESNTATAAITYVVNYGKEKKHTVRVKFQYDSTGKVDKDSIVYV